MHLFVLLCIIRFRRPFFSSSSDSWPVRLDAPSTRLLAERGASVTAIRHVLSPIMRERDPAAVQANAPKSRMSRSRRAF